MITVTDADFTSVVLESAKPVLVDFWADWCAPCRQLEPILEELSRQFEGQVTFTSVDTNQNTGVAMSQDIRTLPTIKIYKDGNVVQAFIGSATKMKLRQALEAVAG